MPPAPALTPPPGDASCSRSHPAPAKAEDLVFEVLPTPTSGMREWAEDARVIVAPRGVLRLGCLCCQAPLVWAHFHMPRALEMHVHSAHAACSAASHACVAPVPPRELTHSTCRALQSACAPCAACYAAWDVCVAPAPFCGLNPSTCRARTGACAPRPTCYVHPLPPTPHMRAEPRLAEPPLA
eukprot:354367-Chlamydomonas_euryale.AAC.6